MKSAGIATVWSGWYQSTKFGNSSCGQAASQITLHESRSLSRLRVPRSHTVKLQVRCASLYTGYSIVNIVIIETRMRHQCAFSRVVTACQYEQNITPRLPPVVHERVDGGGGEESGWGWRRGEVMGVAERRGDGGGGEERGWGWRRGEGMGWVVINNSSRGATNSR